MLCLSELREARQRRFDDRFRNLSSFQPLLLVRDTAAGDDDEWSDLSRRFGRRDHVHSLLPGTSLMAPRIVTEGLEDG